MIEAWRVGVRIALSSNSGMVLGGVGRELFGLERGATALTGKLNAVKIAAIGAMGAIAGTAALMVMRRLVEAGGKLVHQQSLMKQAGISDSDIALGTSAAFGNTQSVRGTIPSENLAQIADLRNILGDLKEAITVSNEMAKINVTLGNVTGQKSEQAGYQFARFLELAGALVNPATHRIDPKQLTDSARLGEAIIAGLRGRVTPAMLLSYQQQARVAGLGLMKNNAEGLINIVPLIQAMGGPRTGTGIASASSQLLGSVMLYKNAIMKLEKIGIIDPHKVVKSGGGRFALQPGALRNTEMFRDNIAKWVWDVLVPQMQAHGMKTMDAQLAFIQASGLRQTVVGLFAELIRNEPAFKKDIANIRTAQGVDTYATQQATDPTANLNAFKAAWEGLLEALGAPLVAQSVSILHALTTAILGLQDWAAHNQRLVGAIEDVTAALSALAVVGGTIMLGGALLGALAVLASPTIGLVALAGGIIALGAAFGKIPRWVIDMAAGAAAGAAAGSWIPGVGTLVGAGVGAIGGGLAGGMLRTHANPTGNAIVNPIGLDIGDAAQIQEFLKRNGAPLTGGSPAVPLHAANGNTPQQQWDKAVGATPIQLQGDVNLDGQKMGTFTANSLANSASRPKTGTTGFNTRIGPLMPGFDPALMTGP